jgi:hypothetical protein
LLHPQAVPAVSVVPVTRQEKAALQVVAVQMHLAAAHQFFLVVVTLAVRQVALHLMVAAAVAVQEAQAATVQAAQVAVVATVTTSAHLLLHHISLVQAAAVAVRLVALQAVAA